MHDVIGQFRSIRSHIVWTSSLITCQNIKWFCSFPRIINKAILIINIFLALFAQVVVTASYGSSFFSSLSSWPVHFALMGHKRKEKISAHKVLVVWTSHLANKRYIKL